MKFHLGRTIGIVASVLAVYVYAVWIAEFVAIDDFKLVTDNPLLQSLTWASIKGMFTSYDPDLYIPLTFLSYHIDRIIAGGFSPLMFHSTNLLLHTLNALFVSVVVRKLSNNTWVGFAAGLLFGLHPLHSEAVMWVSARKDLLSTFFFLVSWVLYLKGNKYAIATFFLALISKVSVIGFPIVLLLTDWYRGRTLNRACLVEKIPYFALSIVFGIVALIGMEGETSLGFATVFLASRSILFYVQKLFAPLGLSVIVPFYEPVTLTNSTLVVSFGAVALLTGVILWSRKKILIFPWLFFLLSLVPSFGNFVHNNEYPLNIYLASDRYAYIASIGIFFAVATILSWHKWRNILLSILVCTLVPLTYMQAQTWKDTPSLFINTLVHYPNSHIARNSMAMLLMRHDQDDLAIGELKKSLESKPNAEAYHQLGLIAEKRNNVPLAREVYLKSLEINPYYLNGFMALAQLALNEGRPDEALEYVRQAELYYSDDPVVVEMRQNIEQY